MLEIEDQLRRYGEALEHELLDRTDHPALTTRSHRRRSRPLLATAATLVVIAIGGGVVVARQSAEDSVAVSTKPTAPSERSAGAPSSVDPSYRLSSEAVPTASLVVESSVWIAFLDADGSARISVFPQGSAQATTSYSLPGEVPAAAIAASKDAVWVATINAEGAALVRLPRATGGSAVVVDRLDRSATLAASGERLWVRSDRLLQQRDGSSGEVLSYRTDLGAGWVATSHDDVWTTDRASGSLLRLAGVATVDSIPLAPPAASIAAVAVNDQNVFAVQGDGSLLVVDVKTGRAKRVTIADRPLEVAAMPSGVAVLSDSALTYYEHDTGRVRSKSLNFPAPRGLAVIGDATQAIVCEAIVRCVEVQLP